MSAYIKALGLFAAIVTGAIGYLWLIAIAPSGIGLIIACLPMLAFLFACCLSLVRARERAKDKVTP